MAKKALGKGLGALIKNNANAPATREPASTNGKSAKKPEASPPTDGEVVERVPLSRVVPSPLQPRRQFTETHIRELMESIREHGVIQPLIVRRTGETLELIAGERRWRASRALDLTEVPVIIRDASDQEVLEMALIENLQRRDLNPIEEAAGYRRLAKEFSLKQDLIARRVGKSRASVANAMRLLDLDEEVQALVAKSEISVGHAKVILGLKDAPTQRLVAEQIIKRKLSVRQTERLIQDLRDPASKRRGPSEPDPRFLGLGQHLTEQFKTPVAITGKGNKGNIEIAYRGEDELKRILELLGLEPGEL